MSKFTKTLKALATTKGIDINASMNHLEKQGVSGVTLSHVIDCADANMQDQNKNLILDIYENADANNENIEKYFNDMAEMVTELEMIDAMLCLANKDMPVH